MGLRAIHIRDNQGDSFQGYFRQKSDVGPFLRVGDILLRSNHGYIGIITDLVRLTTGGMFTHSALLYMEPNPGGQDVQICAVDIVRGAGTRNISWAEEIDPMRGQFDGIKRPRLDWYVETPQEQTGREANNSGDVRGIAYLRKVRDVALKQVPGPYDQKTVWELTALYLERLAKNRLGFLPQVADILDAVERLLEKWDQSTSEGQDWLQFICSGLVQYSFFEGLRQHILSNLDIPANRQAALSNLNNLQHVVFRDDPDGSIAQYIQEVQTGRRDLAEAIPHNVLNVLRTATPADFNNSPKLEWRYIINNYSLWQIYETTENEECEPVSKDEQKILSLMRLAKGPLTR